MPSMHPTQISNPALLLNETSSAILLLSLENGIVVVQMYSLHVQLLRQIDIHLFFQFHVIQKCPNMTQQQSILRQLLNGSLMIYLHYVHEKMMIQGWVMYNLCGCYCLLYIP